MEQGIQVNICTGTKGLIGRLLAEDGDGGTDVQSQWRNGRLLLGIEGRHGERTSLPESTAGAFESNGVLLITRDIANMVGVGIDVADEIGGDVDGVAYRVARASGRMTEKLSGEAGSVFAVGAEEWTIDCIGGSIVIEIKRGVGIGEGAAWMNRCLGGVIPNSAYGRRRYRRP